ncbi:MAG: hypothetical protein U1F98_10270 [Verrucomicrobiota bacterium]
MIVTATEMANEGKSILDRVIQGGEVVEVQRHGKTVAVIHPRVGVTRSELVRLMRGRGFSQADSRQLQKAMDEASEVLGYAGGD